MAISLKDYHSAIFLHIQHLGYIFPSTVYYFCIGKPIRLEDHNAAVRLLAFLF